MRLGLSLEEARCRVDLVALFHALGGMEPDELLPEHLHAEALAQHPALTPRHVCWGAEA